MEYKDLSKYGLDYKAPEKVLQKRGVLDADVLDLPCQIASKFNLNYCDCGVSLCLYEPFTETSSFYALLLVKEKSVLEDDDVQNHESIYKSENMDLWITLSKLKGREIKELISFRETCERAFNQFACFIHSCLILDNSTCYWVKLDETIYNIPLIKANLEKYYVHANSMPNEANILILTAAQDYEEE